MSLSSKPRALILFAALATACMLFAVVFAGQAKAGLMVPAPIVVNDDADGDDTESDNVECDTAPDATTIQGGVDAATAGGTVFVCPGTYTENVTINKNLTLLSTDGRAAATIEGITNGATGTILVSGSTSGVQIGDDGQGFTIIGIDNPNAAVESAAIQYSGGPHTNSQILDNEVRANGEHGIITGYSSAISGFTISGNEFSGKTFVGDNPAGVGFNDQFSLFNVPRQLVVLGNGPTQPPTTTNITFTNNLITGIAGGLNTDDAQQGNTLVTLDVSSSTISGNTFAGETNRFASALRVRQSGTNIEENTFDGSRMAGTATRLITVQNGPFIVGNNLDSQSGATAGIVVDTASTTASAPTIRFNRIVNSESGTAIFNSTATNVDAENNWYGCNEGPGASPTAGCDTNSNTGSGSIDGDPHLVMDITADPATIETNGGPGGTSDIESSFDQNSEGEDVSALFPDGVKVAFDTDLGSVDPMSDSTEMAVAETVLTSGNVVGTANVTASLDAETVGTDVDIAPPAGTPAACEADGAIVGTNGPDLLIGGPGRDIICGLGGDDDIRGLGGSDILIGGPGDDVIRGGDGNDLIRGDAGDDILIGGDGNDRIIGGADNDRLLGQAGNDFLQGGAGDDRLLGGDGNDRLEGQAGNDTLVGQAGNDRLFGQNGNDVLNTRDGVRANDVANGGPGNNRCITDPGDRRVNCQR